MTAIAGLRRAVPAVGTAAVVLVSVVIVAAVLSGSARVVVGWFVVVVAGTGWWQSRRPAPATGPSPDAGAGCGDRPNEPSPQADAGEPHVDPGEQQHASEIDLSVVPPIHLARPTARPGVTGGSADRSTPASATRSTARSVDEGGRGDVVVRVLGEVRVQGAGSPLTESEVELLALLALARPGGGVNVDRLATVLADDEWSTLRVRTVQARVSRLRAKLGTGSDGELLVPAARVGANAPGRYTVSDRVVTDVQLLEAAIADSRRLPMDEAIAALVAGLGLVTGVPFTSRSGYRWAFDDHHVARAEQTVTAAVSRLIDIATAASDVELVGWAVAVGGRAFTGAVGEFGFRAAEAAAACHLGDPRLAASVEAYHARLADELGDSVRSDVGDLVEAPAVADASVDVGRPVHRG